MIKLIMLISFNLFAQQPNITQIESNIITCTKNLKDYGYEPLACKETCKTIPEIVQKQCASPNFYKSYLDNTECLNNLNSMCRSACGCIMWGNVALGLVPFQTKMLQDELAEATQDLAKRKK